MTGRRWLVVIIILIIFPLPVLAQEEIPVDTRQLEQEWQSIQQQYGEYLPEFNWKDIGSTLDFKGLAAGFFRYLLREVLANGALLGQLILLAVFGALLKNLQNAFSNDGVARVSRAVVFLVLLSICVYSFSISMNLARQVVNSMTDFILSLVPVMLALLAGMGSLAAASVFQPVLMTAAGIVGNLVSNVVLPLIFSAAILALVDRMFGAGLNKLAGFLKDASVWVLGFLLTLFVGVTVINGAVASVADGVALRTGKFTAKAFIPVVGGMFSDAFETVAGASLVLKNSIGAFGAVALIVLCCFPLLKLFAITLIYRGAAALLQPLGEDGVSDTLEAMAKYMYAIIGAVAAVALMFFLVITIIVAAANLMVMVR